VLHCVQYEAHYLLARTTAMHTISRKVVLPIVTGVCLVTLLVGVYTLAMLPWFTDYYDFYQNSMRGFEHAAIAKASHLCYPAGGPLVLCILGCGGWLLRSPEVSAARLAWYASASVSLALAWLTWILLVERTFYGLLFPA
jgi:hypothetical protein